MSIKERLSHLKEAVSLHPKNLPLQKGKLVPDPRPVAAAIGYKRTPNMVDLIRAEVARASREAEAQGFETLEEANDFDVGDDVEPGSPYEVDEAAEVPLSVLRQRVREAEEAEKAKAPEKVPATPPVVPPAPPEAQ